MRVVSVNVGLPREVEWRGRTLSTGIFKEPVDGRSGISGVNLDGDGQADPTVHGGPDKAVYAYPVEHYPSWQEELGRELSWGMFGENLTVAGVPLEDEIAVGDLLRVGTAELRVAQPRLPCFKLGIRFDDPQFLKPFLLSGRTGYYLRIVTEGDVGAGDEVEILERDPAGVAVSEITRLFVRDHDDTDGLRRVLSVDALPAGWRSYFEERLDSDAAHRGTVER